MQFGKFANIDEYSKSLQLLRKGRGGKFVTPSELFRPWYGTAVAKWALANRSPRAAGLNILEVGAGNGSTAEDCLQYLRLNAPEVYKTCTYQIVEVTRNLAIMQERRLQRYIDDGIVTILYGSILDWEGVVEEPTCVIALEVLDNMPHDRVVITEEYFFQSHVVWDEWLKKIRYELTPLTDDLILRTGHYWQSREGFRDPGGFCPKNLMHYVIDGFRRVCVLGENQIFMPTAAQRFLEVLRDYFPHHRLLVSDFDFLTRCVAGENGIGPLSSPSRASSSHALTLAHPPKEEMRTQAYYPYLRGCHELWQDEGPLKYLSGLFVIGPLVQTYNPLRIHGCILESPIHGSDVIFPTNFSRLWSAYEEVCGKRASLQTHAQFINQHGCPEETLLGDRTNPMVEEYQNVRYLSTIPSEEDESELSWYFPGPPRKEEEIFLEDVKLENDAR